MIFAGKAFWHKFIKYKEIFYFTRLKLNQWLKCNAIYQVLSKNFDTFTFIKYILINTISLLLLIILLQQKCRNYIIEIV